jgi:hypothetical protein
MSLPPVPALSSAADIQGQRREAIMNPERVRSHRSEFTRDAGITVAAVVVAFLALDDITTDLAGSFLFERLALAACAVWFLFAAGRFWRTRRHVPAIVSFVVVAIAAVAQRNVGPGILPSVDFAYLATVGGLVWFLVVAGIQAWQALLPRK